MSGQIRLSRDLTGQPYFLYLPTYFFTVGG